MGYSYPNQKIIEINKAPLNKDFLGINNEVWQAACRDLRPFAFTLYLYFAANKNGYSFSLSQVAVQEAIGMSRSTYNDQVKILIKKGYLVPSHGNVYEFYEKPQTKDNVSCLTATVNDDENCTALVNLLSEPPDF